MPHHVCPGAFICTRYWYSDQFAHTYEYSPIFLEFSTPELLEPIARTRLRRLVNVETTTTTLAIIRIYVPDRYVPPVCVFFFTSCIPDVHAFLARLPSAMETQRDRPVVSGEEQSERVERMGGGHVRHDPSGGTFPTPQVRSTSTSTAGCTGQDVVY